MILTSAAFGSIDGGGMARSSEDKFRAVHSGHTVAVGAGNSDIHEA